MADNAKTSTVSPTAPPLLQRKRRRPINIFKVARYLRRPSPKPNKPSKGTWWTRLLGSIRLMHVQGTESPQLAIEHEVELKPAVADGERKERPLRPRQEEFLSSPSRSSVAGSSRYQSVENLQELGVPEEEEECWYDGGDRMIDSKAEQFISLFYEQMRLQNMEDDEAVRK